MVHLALDIDQWELYSFDQGDTISYNNRVLYQGLKISATKFYFFLKEKFGLSTIGYESVSQFFQERDINTGLQWCYIFKTYGNYTIVTGDDRINIAVLSLEEPPEELHFEIFANIFGKEIESYNLDKHSNSQFEIYLNYSVLLRSIIDENILVIEKEIPSKPEIDIRIDQVDQKSPEMDYKKLEYKKEYNEWIQAIVPHAKAALQLQILLPIYLEALIDISFRVKLQKKYFDRSIKYSLGKKQVDVFQYFERIDIFKKLKEIRTKCFSVDIDKLKDFENHFRKLNIRQERNKILHGNSLFLKNSNVSNYYDKPYLIGTPNNHDFMKMVTQSIESTLVSENVLAQIDLYENLYERFLDSFNDNGYLKSLVSGVAFGHNSKSGGALGLGLIDLDVIGK